MLIRDAEPLRIGLSGTLYSSRGLPIGIVRLDRVVGDGAPAEYALLQNHPNPFNPATTISCELPEPGYVALNVYDVTGQLVRRLVNGQVNAGHHAVEWDGRDNRGRPVASGVYLCRLVADGGRFFAVRRMVFLK